MEGLNLVRAAHAIGLSVSVDGERLVVRGPASLEPVARALLADKGSVLAALADAAVLGVATEWPAQAQEHFLNRVGAELFVSNGPGTQSWDIAVREANRVAAGVPIPPGGAREPRLIDHALAAFAPMGGLKLDKVVTREQFNPPLPKSKSKQSSPPPSNPDS